MKRIRKVFLMVHIILWTLFTLVVGLQLSQETPYWLRLSAAVLATCLYVFYMHFSLVTQYSDKRKKSGYFLKMGVVLLTGPFIYLLLHYRKLDSWDLFSEYYMISLVSIVVPFLFLSWLARVTENLVVNTVKKEQLEKDAIEAELNYLKSQIAPHFLFNTLNNIHTLVYKQAPTAPEAVMQLASLMRYMIYESNSSTVPLAREMEYLQNYVSLQQLRYRESPVVDLKIEGETEAFNIAPLLFIHLLENAYKHSPARLAPGEVKVSVEVKHDALTFSVQNPVRRNSGSALNEPGGIGLANIRKRLLLLYPDQHTLDIHNSGESFVVVLKIHGLQWQVHERKAHLLYN